MVRPVVMIKQGWLRGIRTRSAVAGSFISFMGIPYAEPPIGDLRFKDPQPPQSWTGIKQATDDGPQCAQTDDFSQTIVGSEDCLYLNVATMSLDGSRPVMVWIHGGGFMWGNGRWGLYGPDYLVKMDVVVVTINYRLGIFGFLSLDHEAAPGNLGLKDQVAALKWVKENIAQFGGDPNNVTIFGESAGSVSVNYHLLSPLTKGLFHKAIAQSGVALNPWACASSVTDIVHRIMLNLGRDITDPNEIVNFLRTIPASRLVEAQHDIMSPEEHTLHDYPFAPTVDCKSKEPFLPRPARELIAEGHDVPFMLGYNSHEGNICLVGFTDESYPLVEQKFAMLVTPSLVGVPSSRIPDALKEIKNFYFGDKRISMETVDAHIRWARDCFFLIGIRETVDIRAKAKSPTYLYRFSHDSPVKLSSVIWRMDIDGAGHFDEIAYLFYPTIFPGVCFVEPGSTEQVISKRFLKMWTDFAKTGNPTPRIDDLITVKWMPVTRSATNYLEINANLSTGVDPDGRAWQFWNQFRSNASEK